MTTPRKPKRATYTDVQKAAAVNAVVNAGATLAEAGALVGGAKASTVRDWCLAAGVDVKSLANRKTGTEQVAAANAARLARSAKERAELIDLIRSDVSLRSARMLAAKLERAEADEELVELARQRWRDALVVEAQAADFGEAAVKSAKKATAMARVDVLVAEASVPNANDLSMILNRSVRDLLAMEGYEHELDNEDAEGRVTVILTAPRPDRSAGGKIVQLPRQEASA